MILLPDYFVKLHKLGVRTFNFSWEYGNTLEIDTIEIFIDLGLKVC